MKIVGYGALWSIALALLVAMCAIIKEGYVGRPNTTDNVVVAGKVATQIVAAHVAARPPAAKDTLRVSLTAAQ